MRCMSSATAGPSYYRSLITERSGVRPKRFARFGYGSLPTALSTESLPPPPKTIARQSKPRRSSSSNPFLNAKKPLANLTANTITANSPSARRQLRHDVGPSRRLVYAPPYTIANAISRPAATATTLTILQAVSS